MKKSLLYIGTALMLAAGCKEVGPAIDFGNVQSIDTAYIMTSGIPATQPHNVLAEDFSGQSCPNCPAADVNLDAQAKSYPAGGGQLNVISMFAPGSPQTAPPNDAKYDLENVIAQDMENNITIYDGLIGLPSVGIDRLSVNNSSGNWDQAITTQAGAMDSLNLLVQSSYSGAPVSMATTTVTVTYTQNVPYAQNLNIAIVEDSIIDFHEEPLGAFDTTYLYMNVFRGFVTSGITGDAINWQGSPNKPQGLYWRQVYTYALPTVSTSVISTNPALVPKHCRVVAYIVNGTNGSIAQSAQTPLGAN